MKSRCAKGLGLNCTLEPVAEVQGASVWRVSDAEKGQHFFATLDDSLELESLRPLQLSSDDLFICRGIALDDDTAANLALQCRLKMI
jgi:adenine-specific DNA-methyltransferase